MLSPSMDNVVFESVCKTFRHRPAMFNWMGRERSGETYALRDFSLTVPRGKVLVLLGPNGSGKSTALKLVSTLLLPDGGRVLVEGLDTLKETDRVCRLAGFAVASERSFFPRLTARENLSFFATLDDVSRESRAQRVDMVLEQTGLLEAADMLVMKFSSGMYQRLGMARAMIKNPSILLLDEPTRSLDPGSATRFYSLVRGLADQNRTVILATHSFNEAVVVGDFVAVLYRGEVVGYRELTFTKRVNELRSFYFGATTELEELPDLVTGGAG